jgi:hypothetical protein
MAGYDKAHLSSSVHNFSCKVLTVVPNDFGERVFDSWVISFNVMAIDKLNCQ